MAKEDKFADEVLSEDELEQVAGGTYEQTSEDSGFLYCYGLCPAFDVLDLQLTSGRAREEQVKAAWAKVGITLDYSGYFGGNRYYLNGKKISRYAAHQHVIDTLGDPFSALIEHHL